ncbi:hypothetical protein H8356DRAFT_1431371 [Neocallimastix lanati (nom. inval.)]|nr:hypothetical protein H8356DRAFT_1431371 [Neocallimastix sp. JGI-2020a]
MHKLLKVKVNYRAKFYCNDKTCVKIQNNIDKYFINILDSNGNNTKYISVEFALDAYKYNGIHLKATGRDVISEDSRPSTTVDIPGMGKKEHIINDNEQVHK